jgi:hypothetical protein
MDYHQYNRTNKEIKDHLRENDLWVKQRDVKLFMDANYQSLGLERFYNGQYYEYSLDTTIPVPQTTPNTSVSINGTQSIQSSTNLYTTRQLNFSKDSNKELFSKLKNPKYEMYKTRIENILNKREVI